MPELPEVETVRRGLAERVVGRTVIDAEVTGARTVRRTSPEAVIAGITGSTITAARRRGKYLLLDLDSGDEMMIHLRMSGQVSVVPPNVALPDHTHVVFHLDDGNEMRFIDPRTFGEVVVFNPANTATAVPELARLGPDPIAEGLSLSQLRSITRGRRRQLKALLLDQSMIAGIGNIYADEILHRARLRPTRHADTLNAAAERRLHESIHDVLGLAIDAGGSTLDDAQYVDVDGEGGSFQDHHRVYGRAGKRCVTCGRGRVRSIQVAQRSTHFCPVCQR